MTDNFFTWRDLIEKFRWNITPISRETKAPLLTDWPATVLSETELGVYFADGRSNVGAVLGETSGGLVDVDLDDPLVAQIAQDLLPETECIFGRLSKPSSHWLYVSTDEIPYQKFRDPTTNACLLELRGDGRQTMVPPSIHPSGEPVRFERSGFPTECDLATLRLACTKIAVTALLVRYWPQKGSRHDAYLAASGALLLGGWSLENTTAVIKLIAKYTEAEGPNYKSRIVEDTFDTIQRGDHPTNWRHLEEILGRVVSRAIRRWLKQTLQVYKDTEKVPLDVGMDIHDLMWRCWEILEQTNVPPVVFQQGGVLVRLEEADNQPILSSIDEVRLHNLLTGRVGFFRQAGSTRLIAQPPGNLTAKLLAETFLPGSRSWVPPVDRVVDHPLVTPEGELILTRGYHPEWRTFLTQDWTDQTSKISFDEAHEVIEDILVDFPFESDVHKTHAVALLIQPFIRLLISGNTPMYFFTAPMPGSGKTLLGKVLLLPSLGKEVSPDPFPEDESEMRKYLTAKLIRDRRVVFFDNVMKMPDLPTLSSVITTGEFESRILGTSASVVVKGPDTWAATGNNPEVHHDMSRRHIPIRLTPTVETPALRTGFRHPRILSYVKDKRKEIVTAICRVCVQGIQEHTSNGKPATTLGSFEVWSDVIGGILQTIGYKDFLKGVGAPSSFVSPSHQFIEFWWHQFGTDPIATKDLIPLANLTMTPLQGDVWTARSLAAQIEHLRDVVIAGTKITYGGKYSGVDHWYLHPTGGEPTVKRDPAQVEALLGGQPTITIRGNSRSP